jgi:hypothetical protein
LLPSILGTLSILVSAAKIFFLSSFGRANHTEDLQYEASTMPFSLPASTEEISQSKLDLLFARLATLKCSIVFATA